MLSHKTCRVFVHVVRGRFVIICCFPPGRIEGGVAIKKIIDAAAGRHSRLLSTAARLVRLELRLTIGDRLLLKGLLILELRFPNVRPGLFRLSFLLFLKPTDRLIHNN